MKVKELIQQLQELDQESIVVVRGYEGGVDEVFDVTPTYVELNVNTRWWFGDHDICDTFEEYMKNNPNYASAVFISK